MLVALLVLAQMPAMPGQPMGPIVSSPATSRSSAPSRAQFEFAPSDGAGMGTECACAAVTGAGGEALTSTRASSGTCTKGTNGLRVTGIADGDLVTCSTNQPRVMRDADGVLAYLAESTRTNTVLQSEEFGDAVWTTSTAAGAVTRTANAATSPGGVLTADRMQYAACPTIGQYSSVLQTVSSLGASSQWSVFVRGNGGAGVIGQIAGAASTYTGGTCAYDSSSWSRCVITGPTVVVDVWAGCVNATVVSPNPGNTGSGDVFIWGGEREAGAFPTSYIPTTGSSAARAVDVASFSVTMSGTTASWAASVQPEGLTSGATFFQHYVDANNSIRAEVNGSNQLLCTFRIGGVDSTVATSATLTVGAVNRVACTYGASGRSACIGGTCVTTAGALTLPTGAATFYVGTRSTTGNEANSLVSRICYQPNSDTRCM